MSEHSDIKIYNKQDARNHFVFIRNRRDISSEYKTNLLSNIVNRVKRPLVRCKNDDDRSLALISFFKGNCFYYNATAALGKSFNVQALRIQTKLSEKYGTNRTHPNGLYCILPMLVDAGFIERQKVGVHIRCASYLHQKKSLSNYTVSLFC